MSAKLFVSLPTADLDRSKTFYAGLGATLNPEMSDDNSACFLWDEDIAIMMLKREYFASVTEKQIVDPKLSAQMQLAFMQPSREAVDSFVDAGLAAGGTEHGAAEDHGFMYTRDVEDPDGNVLAFMHASDQPAQV